MIEGLRWYIVLTRSWAEWQVHRELLNKGIRSYYPQYLANTRKNRWIQGIIKPLFPTYVFVGLEPGESLDRVRQSFGVRDFLRDGGGLVAMSDAQMQRCKAHCDAECDKHVPRRAEEPSLKVGDWAPVPHGAFSGMPCEVTAIDKSGQVTAYIGNLTVTFHISAVQSAPRSAEHTTTSAVTQLKKTG